MQKTPVFQFRLLNDADLKLKVNFDCYTARPHFVIASENQSKKTYEALSVDEKKKVIGLALQMVTIHKLSGSRAILSQHSGSWYNANHNYHAHLCVANVRYLNILGDNSNKFEAWPKKLSYEKIMKYPDEKDKKEGEVQEIKKIIQAEGLPEATEEAHKVTEGIYDVLFHPSEPRVGFAVEKSKKPADDDCSALLDVQKFMMNYAAEINGLGVKVDYKGCHVCLVLDGQKHGKSTIVSELNNLRRN